MKEQRTFGISKRLLSVFILLTMLLGMMIPALSVRSEAADDTYRITLRLNSGKFVNEGTSEYCTQGGVSQNRIYDIPYGVSIYDAIPWEEQIILRNGYVFTGWVYTNSSGSIPSNGWQPSLQNKKPMDIYYTYFRNNTGSCGDVYFTAFWIGNEYKMNFDPKMGTITKGSYSYDVAFDIEGGGDQGVEYYNAMLHDLEAGDVPHAEAEGFTFVSWTLTEYYWSLKPSDELGRPWADGNHYGGTVSETWALTKSATFDGYWECNADNFEDVYIAPTCLTDGFDGQVCLTCQANSEYKDFINNYHEPDGTVLTALGHDMGEWIDQKDGTSRSDCERDGCDYFETRNNTYDIEYYDEGGAAFSGTHGANAPTAHTFGTQTKLVNAANKTGMYTFGGWYSDPECTTAITTIEATDFKSSLDESYKIYAKWIPVDYTITYYYGSTNITTKTAYFPDGLPATGHSYGTDTVLIDAYKRGWTFEGWYTNSSFTTPAEGALSVLDGEGYTANIKLYAKFTEDYYPITYLDKNGEPYSGDTVIADAKLSYTYDDGITFPTVTKTGYTFGGWFADEDCSGTKITKFGAATTDGPQTLYALWTPNSYTITYNYIPAATGTSSNAFDTAAEKAWLSEGYATTHTYDQITTLPTVTREGWTWGGKWFTNAACTTPAEGMNELAGDGYTAAIKLYTRIVVNTYNIEYYDEGGAMYSGENLGSLPATFVYDTAKTLVNGTKTGYTFGGWFTDPECTNKVTALAKNTYAHDVKLYAKWTPNSYAITYLNFNTTSGSINTASYFPNGLAPSTHTYDQDTIIPVPVRADYYFLGWYTSKAATAGTEVPMVDGQYTIDGTSYTAKFTLYAKWEKVSAHVCTPGAVVIENNVAPDCTNPGSYDEVTYCTLPQCGKECSRNTVTVPATGHAYDNGTVTTKPTCTDAGIKTFVCANDPTHTYTEPVEKLGHDYIDHAGKSATCLEGGWEAYQTCSRCDYSSYKAIPATGHAYDNGTVTTEPTCTEAGVKTFVCANDATHTYTEPVAKLGHNYVATVTPPTCTEAGYTTYVCERCGDTYTDDSTAALDHLWGEWYTVEEATYFADGLERRDCQRGDATEERAIPMLKDNTPPTVTVTTDPEFDVTDGETDYSNTDVEITIEAFDNETGIDEIYYIITDEDTKVVEEGIYDPESKPVLSEEGEYTVTAKAVDNAGNETEVVTDTIVIDKTAPVIGGIVDGEIYCGEEEISFTVDEKYIDKVYVNGEEVSEYVLEGTPEGTEYTVTVTDKAGNSTEVTVTVYSEHNYAGTVTESPSCTEDGEMTYVCANCGDSYTEAIESLGHIEVTDEAAAPKCEETGLTEGKHCERCGTVLVAQEVVDAHGHNYVVTDHKDESCTEDGYDVYTCTHDASHTYTDVIPAHGHSYELTDVVPPTCTENGYSVYTCPDCGDSYTADPVDAEGHQYELTVTDPTCTEGGHTTYVCGVCKDTYVSDYTDALGHEEKVIPAVAPGCTEDGSTEGKYCDRCGELLIAPEVDPAHGHNYVVTDHKDESCTEDGYDVYTCTHDASHTYTDVIPAHGHSYELTDVVPPTCTENGYSVYTCPDCDDSYHADPVDAEGHQYELTVTDPTCTEGGYTTYICGVCGDTYVSDYTDALGHEEKVIPAVAPGCTEDGSTEGKYCNRCGELLIAPEVDPAHGHNYVVTDHKDASCTEDGYDVYTCTHDASHTYTVTYTKLGHIEVTDEAAAPKCEETGLTEGKHCERCGTVLVAQEVVDAHGHNYVVTDHKDASCTEDGYDVYTCTHDASHTYTVTYTKLGHIEVTDAAAAPKCEETGLTEGKHCERCGTVLVAQEVVDAHGHNYVVTDHKDENCTEDGYDVYTCTHDASHTYTVTYTKLGHIEVTDEAAAPKCEETGLTEGMHCERCGTVLVAQEIVDATGHAYDNGVVTTEPTCTADGIKTFTCANDASHTYTEAVSKLGHKALEAVQENYAAPKCFVEGSYDMAVYCERCGTELSRETVTVPALEHKYAFASDKLVKCANCGDLYNGFFENTDTTYCEAGMYYCIEGVPQKDLFVVDGYYYYGHSDKNGRLAENEVVLITTPAKNAFNAENPEYFLNGVFSCYEFLDDCKMKKDGYVTGVDIYGLTKTWLYEDYQLVMGLRRFESEDGQLYYRFFNRAQGYMYTDHSLWITEINDVEANAYQGDYGLPHGWYEIGSDGNIILPEGLFIIYQNGKYYLTENGWKQPQGLYELEEGVYVYVKTGLTLAVDEVIWLTDEYKNGLIPAPDCFYYFGEDFVMETDCFVTWLGKSYYINADATVALGFTKIGDDYYYFNNKSGIMYKDTTLWVGVNDYGFTPNNYYFMEDGKMYVPSVTGIKEIVEENGKLYFVIDGVKQTGGLYELDGEYYYALSDGSLVRNSSVWVASNDYIPANNYRFDANGKLVKTGFVNASNGYTYYYNDLVLAKGLTKIGEDYYFFNTSSGMMYCDTTLWVGADNAYGLDAGYYYFDTDGKLYVAPATGVKKVIEENGMLYFTIDGVKQGGGLYELDGDYYYVLSNSTILVASSVYLNASLASEFGGAEGYYGFDSEGKLIKTGFVNASNGYTYYYNNLVKAKGFTKIGDDYYFFNASSGSMYKNISLWVSTNSYGVKAGTYRFGEDGKMVK